jgi:hypothetical protein
MRVSSSDRQVTKRRMAAIGVVAMATLRLDDGPQHARKPKQLRNESGLVGGHRRGSESRESARPIARRGVTRNTPPP